MKTKLKTKLVSIKDAKKWMADNPIIYYGDYNDCISDEIAAGILLGDQNIMDDFADECEDNAKLAYYKEFTFDFASYCGVEEFSELPKTYRKIFDENLIVDASHLIEKSIKNWDGKVTATLLKRDGSYINAPHCYTDRDTNRKLARYMRDTFGFVEDEQYPDASVRALIRIDLWPIWKSGKAPSHITIDETTTLVAYEYWNGSGGSLFNTKNPREFRAKFAVDSLTRYSIDSTYWLTGTAWKPAKIR